MSLAEIAVPEITQFQYALRYNMHSLARHSPPPPVPYIRDEEIGWFDVSMHDTFPVQVSERISKLFEIIRS